MSRVGLGLPAAIEPVEDAGGLRLYVNHGKQPADLACATATPNKMPLLAVGVASLRGVSAAGFISAQLSQVPAGAVAATSLGGRPATFVTHGARPVWYAPVGEPLYAIVGTEEQAAEAAAALP